MVSKLMVGEAEAPPLNDIKAEGPGKPETPPIEPQGEFPPTVLPTLDPGPVPEDASPRFVPLLYSALRGEPGALDVAFTWALTDQGYLYWSEQEARLHNGVPLSSEAAAILRAWIEQVEGAKP